MTLDEHDHNYRISVWDRKPLSWLAFLQSRRAATRTKAKERVRMKQITTMGRVAVVLVLGLLAAAGASCSKDRTADEMLTLNFWEFDQNQVTGWRPYADRGEYERAADLIDYYLAHRPDLIEAQRGYLHLHAGKLRAYAGDDRRALDHLQQAVVAPDSMPDRFPRSFNALAAGTRAFVAGDMEGVRANLAAIRAMPVLAARDSMFLWSLEHLAAREGKTLREVELEE
jgi:hypothetical protein